MPIGLKQLHERLNEIKVNLGNLKDKHNLKAYSRLANFSKDLSDPLIFEFDSTSEIHKGLVRTLEEIKEASLIGIVKTIDTMMDRISDRVSDGKRHDELDNAFCLLVNYALPNTYSEQASLYFDVLDELLHAESEMEAAYGVAA